MPASSGVQVPGEEPLQVTQSPEQSVAQQTPSMQRPDAHAAPVEHAAPFASADVHVPLQTAPIAQWLPSLQLVRQAPDGPHANGAQLEDIGTHVPEPEQAWVVRVLPAHVGALQVVSAPG